MSVTELSVVQLAIGAAILAVLYGAFMSKWIVNLPAGNKKMKDIAAAYSKRCLLLI
jgi:K(+)-stimulated pyrophosphate-energized sodium pump